MCLREVRRFFKPLCDSKNTIPRQCPFLQIKTCCCTFVKIFVVLCLTSLKCPSSNFFSHTQSPWEREAMLLQQDQTYGSRTYIRMHKKDDGVTSWKRYKTIFFRLLDKSMPILLLAVTLILQKHVDSRKKDVKKKQNIKLNSKLSPNNRMDSTWPEPPKIEISNNILKKCVDTKRVVFVDYVPLRVMRSDPRSTMTLLVSPTSYTATLVVSWVAVCMLLTDCERSADFSSIALLDSLRSSKVIFCVTSNKLAASRSILSIKCACYFVFWTHKSVSCVQRMWKHTNNRLNVR